MSPHLSRPPFTRKSTGRPARLRLVSAMVPGIVGLSLLSGLAQVASSGPAHARPEVQVSVAASEPEADEARGATVTPVDFVELPSASVEAISL